MATVKEMRTRIAAVKSTQKITKAMQMVAAAKLRRAQNAAQSGRPYAERMAAVIANLHGKHQGLLDKIRVEKDLKNVEDDLKAALGAFADSFA